MLRAKKEIQKMKNVIGQEKERVIVLMAQRWEAIYEITVMIMIISQEKANRGKRDVIGEGKKTKN